MVRSILSGIRRKLVAVRQPELLRAARAFHLLRPSGNCQDPAQVFLRLASNAGILGDVGDSCQLDEALHMHRSGAPISQHIIGCFLRECCKTNDLVAGKRVQFLIVSNGLSSLALLGEQLVHLFASCGRLLEANIVFCMIAEAKACTWHAIILAHVTNEQNDQALVLYYKMLQDGITPNKLTFMCVMKACGSLGAADQLKQVHDWTIISGFESDEFLKSTLMDMYAKCGNMVEARKMFEMSPNQNVVLWTTIITRYAQHGQSLYALRLFKDMLNKGIKPNEVTFLCILKACSSIGAIAEGKLIHDQINYCGLGSELLVGNTLIDMYAKCGSLEDARRLFDKLQGRTIVSWGAMISGYAEHGHGLLALELAQEMQHKGIKANKIIFVCILKACSSIGGIGQGEVIHNQIIRDGCESDVLIGSTLIDMYAKCQSLEEAHKVFHELPNRNVVSWGAMIHGYAHHGYGHPALELFEKMKTEGIKPDRVIFLSVLKACSSIDAIGQARLIHEHIIHVGLESDVAVCNTLIDMYAKCRRPDEANTLFNGLPNQSSVSWNAMIAGCVELGHNNSALELFDEMQQQGVKADRFTFSCILKTCGSIGALRQGKFIHAKVIQCGLESELAVQNSLIDMYARCSDLEDSHKVFDGLPSPGIVSWGALIGGYAHHGKFFLACQCLQRMQRQGLKPNDVIFTSLLSACSHAGQLEEGCHLFKSMKEDHGIMPSVEHFTCMVDLLGGVGCLREAERFLHTMPIPSNVTGWLSLLMACRMSGNIKLGRQCFDQVFHLDSNSSAGHVLMSNIYADADRWEDVTKIQQLRKDCAWKKPGMAWIEVHDNVHEFVVGDTSHPQSHIVYANLKRLEKLMKGEGYAPQVDLVLEPMSEKDKERVLCKHSERLAISFGLLSTPKGTTIRVTKNLRVCTDCHNASKLISKIEKRKIIICDAHRVHEFEGESCSCEDHY